MQTFSTHSRTRGFTLIEAMVTVAILGIIAAIAYPSYLDQVRRGNRTDAQTDLLEIGNRLQRCYSQYGRYDHANCPVGSSVTTERGYYTVAITKAAASYTLTATAAGAQAKDKKCSKLIYDSTGRKAAEDSNGSASLASSKCWG